MCLLPRTREGPLCVCYVPASMAWRASPRGCFTVTRSQLRIELHRAHLPGLRRYVPRPFCGPDCVAFLTGLPADLLDRGWLRSGTFLYLPDNSRTCCPNIAIRLDVTKFRPSASQRKVLRRFRRFVRGQQQQQLRQGKKSATAPSGSATSYSDERARFLPAVTGVVQQLLGEAAPRVWDESRFKVRRPAAVCLR